MTPALTDAVEPYHEVMVEPAWGADLSVIEDARPGEPSSPRVPAARPGGWLLAVVLATLAVAVALTALAMVTAHHASAGPVSTPAFAHPEAGPNS